MFRLNLSQNKRFILHLDADAFFATVEQVLNSSLKGKALLVGGPTSTKGIVSAASYEAKAYGIYSGMPMYLAMQKCPNAVVVHGNFDVYREFSKRMYQILISFTPEVEMASIDEAYLDLTGCELLYKQSAENLSRNILNKINRKLGISVSGGLASSKTVAKVASSTNKPHKLTIIPYGKEIEFLSSLKLKAIPGVGHKTLPLLEAHGFKTIGDIAKLKMDDILDRFGIQGIPLWKKCRGIDNSPVISGASLPKSISKEHTFYESTFDPKVCVDYLRDLSEMVFSKLRVHRMRARTVFIKIRYKVPVEGGEFAKRKAFFEDFSFQKNVDMPTASDKKLFPEMKNLFLQNLTGENPVRLIGIGVSNLVQNYNLSLFGNDDREENLFLEIDAVKKLYGEEVLKYGV